MQRVLVIGASGAGKSSLAARISKATGLPFKPTDDFYWKEDWQAASEASVVEQIDSVTARPQWVLDGNFDDQRHFVWQRADTIVWLDFPRAVILARAVKRNILLLLTQQPTWSGNRMTVRRAWSGIRHSFRSVDPKRELYPARLAELPHATILRFRSPRQVEKWLVTVGR